MTDNRSELDVITAIDKLENDEISSLVNHSLTRPIVDDYSVNRFDRCDFCGNQWHGLPEYHSGRTCPGAWATDEAKTIWQQMFPSRPQTRVYKQTIGWQLHRESARINLDGELRIALFRKDSNVTEVDYYTDASDEHPSGHGYSTGGLFLSLAYLGLQYYFAANPTWTAGHCGIRARYAAIYVPYVGSILCHTNLCSMGELIVESRNTLTIDNATTPMMELI
jgi:hypothetical protein